MGRPLGSRNRVSRSDLGVFRQPKKKIDFREENGCFICTFHAVGAQGYPVIRKYRKNTTVARFIYEECFGPIPAELILRHTCDNRQCINPEHLILGTRYDNMQDMISRGRARHPSTKGIARRKAK